MSGLFSTLDAGLSALTAFDKALQVSQSNVSNASSPGYAKQTATLESLPFDLSTGQTGGVVAGPTGNARDEYLEQAVRSQAESLGNFSAQSQALASIETIFSISGQSGLSGALNNLFQSFSSWANSPDSASARQDVLAKTQSLAQAFQQAAAGLSTATRGLNSKIDGTVQQINTLASQIRDYNVQIRQSGGSNPGVDARLHDAVESLSGLTGIAVRFESDGTATVLLGGQTPLVLGAQAFPLQTGYVDSGVPLNPNATPAAHILDSSGQDVTAHVSRGTLGGLLQLRNTVLPSLQGDGQQVGSLNTLAKFVADRVNTVLQSGQTSAGQSGVPLFVYDASSNANIARTLAVSSTITAAQLAPVDPGPPLVSNGTALALANLATSANPANQINGKSLLDFYSGIATDVGQRSASANDGQQTATQSLAQARAFRSTVSGVSLDEEAVHLTELQRGYQAASKLISVVDSLTQTLLNMVN